MSIQTFLKGFMREGALAVRLPGGEVVNAGEGDPRLTLTIHDRKTLARLAAQPAMALGEGWMDGTITLEGGELYELLDLLGRNLKLQPRRRTGPLRRAFNDRLRQWNARRQALANVHHHYDLSVDLYRRFLDPDMQYSCAYFAHPGIGLDAAQVAKKRHIAAKLLLKPDMSVLDIGCGWGGLGLTLAEEHHAKVLGVTLSSEQLAVAKERAAARRMDDRARFSLTDYRDVTGPFDRVVSVGMFEHVGRPNYQTYFDQVARLLKDDGVAVIHSIGRLDGPGVTDGWIAKYIFPGGYIPALSEVLPAVERAGLMVTDIEILRLHYAETLKAWRARFNAQRGEIAAIYDERFCRMWEYYLAASEIAFRHRDHMVFQLQLTKRVDTVPLTRDYIAEAEHAAPSRRRHRVALAP